MIIAGVARIISAAFSAIIITGALVLPEVMVGITEASATRRPVDAAQPQAVVDHGERIRAHPAGADRVEDRRADRARGPASSSSLCRRARA